MARFTSGLSGPFDLEYGCYVEMQLGVDRVTAAYLREKNQPVPPPVSLRGLIDTGSTATCFDSAYFCQLSLQTRGYARWLTAGGVIFAPKCLVSIRLLLENRSWEVDYHLCAAFNNLSSGGQGALIGLDILSHFHFTLEGPHSRFHLSLPEVGTEPLPPPVMDGAAYFDPDRGCFLRNVSGEWHEYHPDQPRKPGLFDKIKKPFGPRP